MPCSEGAVPGGGGTGLPAVAEPLYNPGGEKKAGQRYGGAPHVEGSPT